MAENKNEQNNKTKDNNDDNTTSDRVKVTVSSVKEEQYSQKSNNNMNDTSTTKVGFLKTFYYSTIRLDKIHNSIEHNVLWKRYILSIILILSIVLGIFIGLGYVKKIEHFKNNLVNLPEWTYKNGKIEGEVDTQFVEEGTNRLIIINTVGTVDEIRDKYKKEIDNVDQYILITKDIIYVEPGSSIEYSAFNFLQGKTYTNSDLNNLLNNLLNTRIAMFLAGILSSLLILSILVFFTFLIGKLLITILTIYGIKTFDFMRIDKLTVFLMTTPLIVYTALTILNVLNILKLPIDRLVFFYIIYVVYIVIAIYILKRKYTGITVIKNIDDLKERIEFSTENTMARLEEEEKFKRKEKKKLKKKAEETEEKKEDEIVEGV